MSRDLLLVAFSLFTWGIGEGMFIFFQPVYMQELGANPDRIGAIFGLFGLAMALLHIPAGYLADHIGRRPLLWLSWSLGLFSTLIMAAARSLPVFLIGSLIYALTFFVMSPLNSYITAARGRLAVSQAIMLVSGAYSLGSVIGPLVGGMLGERMGMRFIFAVSAGIFAISTLIVLFIRSQPVDPHPPELGRFSFLSEPRYRVYLFVVFLATLAVYFPVPLSQNFLHFERGLGLAEIGRLASFLGLGVAGLNLLMGFFSARLGFALAQVMVGFASLLILYGGGLGWYALGYFLLGGYKTTRSLATAQVRSLVHAGSMGLAYGVTELSGSLATFIAPVIAGQLYIYNPGWIYIGAVALVCISVTAALRFSPRAVVAPSPLPDSS